jgi:hypothetical protein
MSMSFYAAKVENNMFSPVYDFKVTTACLWPNGFDGEPVENPDYIQELDLNFANGNAYRLLQLCGYEAEDGCFHAEIGEFGERVETALLTAPTDYVERSLRRLLALAEYGIKNGATHVYAA